MLGATFLVSKLLSVRAPRVGQLQPIIGRGWPPQVNYVLL